MTKRTKETPTIASIIEQALEDSRFTITEFARRAGVSRKTLWQWRNGLAIPDLKRAHSLSAVTGLTFREIVDASVSDRTKEIENIRE